MLVHNLESDRILSDGRIRWVPIGSVIGFFHLGSSISKIHFHRICRIIHLENVISFTFAGCDMSLGQLVYLYHSSM